MTILELFVGLDYHQNSVQVCVLSSEGKMLANRSCPNNVEAVAEFVMSYGYPRTLAIEACCGAADFADQLQRRYSWQAQLAHPGYVRRLKQSPDKSVHDDAYLLADLARVDYLPKVWLASAETRALRRLVRYRQQLRRARTEVKQQLLGLLREDRLQGAPASPWTKRWFAWLETAPLGQHASWVAQQHIRRLADLNAQIKQADQRLEEATAGDPLMAKLLKEPGIGPTTAVTLRAEIGQFERFRNGKQLARFCGVTPCNASSGKRQADAGLVRQSNRELRSIVLETAHRLTRYDKRWADYKRQLVSRGKPRSVAAAAVANRWIRGLHSRLIDAAPPDGVPARQPAGTTDA
jgi:transposase